MKELSKDLTLDMLSSELYTQIAEAIGIENFYKLTEVIGGTTVYIPKPESLVRPIREARLKAEFNGYNHTELARRYGFSVRWVKELCGEGYPEGQICLFDLGTCLQTEHEND